ncbi:MAG: YesU family protein [Planctomycetota bacterium]|nr:YesU family protein [Planctomycetota bacterium]
MPFEYPNQEELHADDFETLERWHHEGIGELVKLDGGGMQLHCFGSQQGREGCMAFFRPTLPDQIAVEYDLTVHSHGGLVINYLAMRGLHGEDMLADAAKLPPRPGIMANYYAEKDGLQSYHVSISRFGDDGQHTATSNWRRNPGGLLVGHGIDPCKEIGRRYRVRVVKDLGHLQFFADGQFAHGFVDWADAPRKRPDYGKFGFRTIGSDVKISVQHFRVYRVKANEGQWKPWTG